MSDQTPHVAPTFGATGSLAPEYFDRLYTASADPWEFESNAYEAAKYAATLAALPCPVYARALELGCSIGVLTRQLAGRCQRLLATDVSAAALARARERCAGLGHVEFERRDLANSFPAGGFDLILVSEVGYYFSPADLEILRGNIAAALAPGGHLLLVHFTGETNYPQTADAVHACFLAWEGPAWQRASSHRADRYRLDLLVKCPAPTGSPPDFH